MKLPKRLLAKGVNRQEPVVNGSPETLLGHLRDVHAAAQSVVDETAGAQLGAVGLNGGEWSDRLQRVVVLAAALHDLGKANDHFQRMVHGDSRQRQGMRHEWVTYWICQQKPWSTWGPQAAGGEENWRIVLWSIAGHHPAKNRPSPPTSKSDECCNNELVLLATHTDFRKCLEWLENTFQPGLLPESMPETDPVLKLAGNRDSAFNVTARSEQDSQWRRIKRKPEMKRFVAIVKASLLAADVAGSWSGQQLASDAAAHATREPLELVASGLKTKPEPHHIEKLVRIRLEGNPERKIQTAVAESRHRVTLVKAGCGSGKTAAAYLWAARAWPGRRLYFCYPTTGTATEGFRDYLFDEELLVPRVLGAQLFHSRAEVDADLILHVDENDDQADPAEQWKRADALSAWSTPAVCCTVDRVLGLLQNWRTGLMTWPVLAQSAFVFDEIHAYDNRLFELLLRFLKDCPGLPVLLMTASLPEHRRAAIVRVLDQQSESLREITGPQELEQRPRYHRRAADDPAGLIADEVASGGRVLRVCNTVDRAMLAADELRQRGLDPMIYHSRFRYCDRVEQHNRVINAFKPPGAGESHRSGAVAVTTQVAEMSLDLQAATLLVTDLCPVPSLIQRLGRLNRAAADGDPTRPFVVVEPTDNDGKFTPLPYGTADHEFGEWPDETRAWLDSLGTGPSPISQWHLAEAWQSQSTAPGPVSAGCCWLDGGPVTSVDAVREGSYGQTVLLESDRDDVVSGRKPIAEVALPMPPIPKHLKQQATQRCKGLLVIPDLLITYSRLLGAKWMNESQRERPDALPAALNQF